MLISGRKLFRSGCHRWLVVFTASMVIFLSVAAASPLVHRWLHDAATDVDDACAVVLFAGGISVPLAAVLTTVLFAWRTVRRAIAKTILLTARRYLLMPERGPPQAD
jgi:hypothetical protein